MNTRSTKKATLLLGVAALATSAGNVAVKAGPALQTLNNLTNTAEFSINNTYGQSFSVDGMIGASTAITPFKAGSIAGLVNFTTGTATLTTGFVGESFGGYKSVSQVKAVVAPSPLLTVPVLLDATVLAGVTLNATGGTQTIGASISSTLFGPSTVRATTSFTNQLINDLSAF
jgi:hypothetical protein